jgi:hypothetical protein
MFLLLVNCPKTEKCPLNLHVCLSKAVGCHLFKPIECIVTLTSLTGQADARCPKLELREGLELLKVCDWEAHRCCLLNTSVLMLRDEALLVWDASHFIRAEQDCVHLALPILLFT